MRAIPGCPTSAVIARWKFVMTVSGCRWGSIWARCNPVVESSRITSCPGSTRVKAARARASFSARCSRVGGLAGGLLREQLTLGQGPAVSLLRVLVAVEVLQQDAQVVVTPRQLLAVNGRRRELLRQLREQVRGLAQEPLG